MSERVPAKRDREELERRLAQLERELEEAKRRTGELQLTLDTITTIDPVTGVQNRLGTLQSIEAAIQWNQREDRPFGVLSVRIPALADLIAHEDAVSGEEALAHVGAVLGAGIRAVDRVGRWSDDTFLVVLQRLEDTDGASVVCTRLASMLSAVPFTTERGAYDLTPRMSTAFVTVGSRVTVNEIVDGLDELEGSFDPSHPEVLLFAG